MSSSSSSNNNNNNNTPLVPRIASGSFGAIITALAVTPLEVVKVRQQAAAAVGNNNHNNNNIGKITQCPRGCGTFVLNNGLMDCVLPKSSVPYFDKFGSYVNGGRITTATTTSSSAPQINGTYAHLRQIFKQEGLNGLYAGLRPTLIMSVPNTVLYFTAYDEIANRLRATPYFFQNAANDVDNDNNDGNNAAAMLVPLLSGSMARFLASLVTSPLELLKTRQASLVGSGLLPQGTPPPGMLQELRSLLQTEGSSSTVSISTLYKGLAPTLWRDVPFSAVYWLCLERFKSKLSTLDGTLGGKQYLDKGESIPPVLSAAHAFASGAGAGMIAAFFTAPFDVVKTRLQLGETTTGLQLQQQQEVALAARAAASTTTTSSSSTTVICDHGGAVAYNPHFHSTSIPTTITTTTKTTTTTTTTTNLSTFDHMKNIVKEEGIASLWKGNQTRMIKVAPACAIMISCYEFGKKVFSV